MLEPGIICEAGRCLQLKGAKVVTGARQTGVKDRNFEASAADFGARNRAATVQVLPEAAKDDGPPFL